MVKKHWYAVYVRSRNEKKVYELIKEKDMNDVLVTGGGIIPEEDMKKLHTIGVGKLFPPGTDTELVVNYIKDEVKKKRNF